jgi:7-cyano-7-deazaguanine synthase
MPSYYFQVGLIHLSLLSKSALHTVIAVSFDHGQRHNSELVAAKSIAETAEVVHRIIDIDIAQLGGSSLTERV